MDEDDLAFFREAMANVTPLKRSGTVIQHDKPLRSEPLVRVRLPELEKKPLSMTIRQIGAQELISFRRPGLQNRIFQTFKQGKMPCEACLDLHHLRWEEAEQAVANFLAQCVRRSYRTVRIVHGKGERNEGAPVLKNAVNQWLRQYSHVLAFHSANPRQGGVGAVNVLLRSLHEAS